jgi:Flp pilus assembly pilin Flp
MEKLQAMVASVKRFMEERAKDGQALVEYALILVLVAIAVMVMLTALGGTVNTTFDTVNTKLNDGISAGSGS